jgi:hypothetical protein
MYEVVYTKLCGWSRQHCSDAYFTCSIEINLTLSIVSRRRTTLQYQSATNM